MKRFILLLLLIALPFSMSVQAQDVDPMDVLSIHTGLLLQDGYKGEMAYAVNLEAPTYQVWLLKDMVTKVEGSVLYSDRGYNGTAEITALRAFTVRQWDLGRKWYAGIGGGYWHFINTDGPDDGHFALRLEAGKKIAGVEFYVGGDIVRTPSTLFFPHIGVTIM